MDANSRVSDGRLGNAGVELDVPIRKLAGPRMRNITMLLTWLPRGEGCAG